jgi:hypothetical protein
MEFLKFKKTVKPRKSKKLSGCGDCGCDTCVAGYKNKADAVRGLLQSMPKLKGGNIFDDLSDLSPALLSKVPEYGAFLGPTAEIALSILDPFRKNPRNPKTSENMTPEEKAEDQQKNPHRWGILTPAESAENNRRLDEIERQQQEKARAVRKAPIKQDYSGYLKQKRGGIKPVKTRKGTQSKKDFMAWVRSHKKNKN